MQEENQEKIEASELHELDYEIVKDARIERFFSFDLEVDDEGFFYDDAELLLGAVVHFDSYPVHEQLNEIFHDLMVKAIMTTMEVDGEEAAELADEYDADEFPSELSLSEDFSLFFTVEGYRGLYRLRILYGDTHVSWSNGRRDEKWDV